MKKTVALLLALSLGIGIPMLASATTVDLAFSGSGITANIDITYGTVTDSKVSQGFVITGVSGTFSDSNIGISDASIRGLLAVNDATPEATNLLAPHDFSRFAVAEGLSPESHGFLTYDNLYYPGGSPATASDYPAAGGVFDIYGLMFRIGDGRVVDLWSNGIFGPPGSAPIEYGVGVATVDSALDYVAGGVSAVPEPVNGALFLCGLCTLGLFWRRRPR
jgi:hypothetical protein